MKEASMGYFDYMKDRAVVLLAHTTGIFLLSIYLHLIGNSSDSIILIAGIWIGSVALFFAVDYYRRRRYFKNLFALLGELENPYLISEVMESSLHLEDRLYREVLRKSNKSVIEKINKLEDAQRNYKEYIETWIHETKLPLTAATLICENKKSEESRKILVEHKKIEQQIQQVLFYARMEYTSKDYLIHRVNVRDMVLEAIAANKSYFIQSGIQIVLELLEEPPVIIATDEKWVVFMLNQVFSNCIKYRKQDAPCIRIYGEQGWQQYSLIIEDNGIGIAKEDVRRIFDKGFTGRNGRTGKQSTGIGLYLCKGLCDRLGIGITCETKEGKYTRMIFTFPNSDFHHPGSLSKM